MGCLKRLAVHSFGRPTPLANGSENKELVLSIRPIANQRCVSVCGHECDRFVVSQAGDPLIICLRVRCFRRSPHVAIAARGSASHLKRHEAPHCLLLTLPTGAFGRTHGEIRFVL